jgi:hypothetical protein
MVLVAGENEEQVDAMDHRLTAAMAKARAGRESLS